MAVGLVILLVSFFLNSAFCQRGRGYHISPCDQSSCYPATGDLLVGREKNLTTDSTCGLNQPERYCIVSHLEDQNNKCFVCDSRQPFTLSNKMSHRVENIVSTFKKDWKLRWWQAKTGSEKAYIQLDLEAEFHFTHLILRFKTFRPAAMLIERSYDFGKTWKVYRYFAYDCAESFPGVPVNSIKSIQDVICESRYSDTTPSTEGEVIFRVLPASVEIEDPYSEEVQDLLKMTNLRVNFTKLHTLGDNLLDNRAEIKEKYYYSVYSMVVRGSCSCYGHASTCKPLPGQENNANMVHGRCECTHNTKGLNCEQCDDFYNDLPWKPAQGRDKNECKKCDCNNHSTKCHFDPAVYVATGYISGGICDDCQHNTMGHHCEECKPFFFQDPYRSITDPYVCSPCDCDPIGSEHGGECESRTDPDSNLIAGRCTCKRFVEGTRCDTCMEGYWNMRAENPDGCEACGCHPTGSVSGYSCQSYTGECQCKRYVTGRQCDECVSGYWGLGSDPQGCKACDCDVGGSYDNQCDQWTGQCKCRPNLTGRQCNQMMPQHFFSNLDYLRYEGEFARGIGNTVVIHRERIPGRTITWTGPGFMRMSEGSSLEFVVDNIPFSMEYDIIIRYEAQMPLIWDDVRMTIDRPGLPDQRGACANSIPQDDYRSISLSPTTRHYMVLPSSCLERDVRYTIKLDFSRYRSNRATPEASILVDSIVLMPSHTGHPIMQPGDPRSIKDEFDRFRCRDHHVAGVHSPLSDICRRLIYSHSVSIHDGAFACECDPTGSLHLRCEPVGGKCQCKPNVMGRKCDQCVPGTYGFGPAGCTACDCNQRGSRDGFCHPVTGQCNCVPNAYGLQCGSCQRGFWSFPNCRPCQCNGRAEVCDNDSGLCLQCRESTGGQYCERCADGFYGDPRTGCQPCRCPGGQGSNFQHASTCRLDVRSNQVICDCSPGYAGLSCDRCAENYFGNPTVPGGRCERCSCNNNIDFNLPGSCDQRTGECLKCQYNTEGVGCERCKVGFFGEASRQSCRPCICNILGTHRQSLQACDQRSGQCRCLPHVVGTQCNQCEPNYWKLASGQGCEPCHCDPHGSYNSQCNEFDGQCYCTEGFGGRDCSECADLLWGDPRTSCRQCNCNAQGSLSRQCDRRTGQCQCAPGVTGPRCDRCARGTTGDLPHCKPCGECFDNWDTIIRQLQIDTSELIRDGSNIKHGGASGAFDSEFREMEIKLDEVRRILGGDTDVPTEGIDSLQKQLADIRFNLTHSSNEIDQVDYNIQDTTLRVETVNNRIESLKWRVNELKKMANDLRKDATSIQEKDVSGAFESIKESANRSEWAQRRVDSTTRIIRQSESVRQQADSLIRNRKTEFDRVYNKNEVAVREINVTLSDFRRKIVDLNDVVCDGHGDPCNSICGGAGCGKCGGGASCQNGAVSKSLDSKSLSMRANTMLLEKQRDAETILTEVDTLKQQCQQTAEEAQSAHMKAEETKNISESTRQELRQLIDNIEDALQQNGATPDEIRSVAEEVLRMSISLTPDQILNLARQINQTIQSLTNIDAILNATRDKLNTVNALKRRADDVKDKADETLAQARRIIELLELAKNAQNAASTAIDEAKLNITIAEQDLTQIENNIFDANIQSNETRIKVYDFRDRVKALQVKFAENQINVYRAEEEADGAEQLAENAEQDAAELETKYTELKQKLEEKFNQTRYAKEKASTLKTKANDMYNSIYSKVQSLQEWDRRFSEQEGKLINIQRLILEHNDIMTELVVSIKSSERYLRTCGTA